MGSTREFINWSGSVSCQPTEWHRPADEADVVHLVRDARERGRTVRPVGSGHSSTPLVATDDALVDLHRLSGVVSTDPEQGLATVLPGTGLADLGRELAEAGVGMENLGDVDYQSIAGALATGTHGTGARIGNLSSMLVGGRLVTGTGEVIAFGTDRPKNQHQPDDGDDRLLRAAQASLGSLGILTSLTLRVRPAYQLHRTNWMTHIDWVLEHYAELVEQNRNFDFYWYPRSDLAQVRMLNEPGDEPELVPPGRLKRDETGPSYEIIPNRREIHFEEMEYMLPLDTTLEAFRQVRQRVKERHRDRVGWRVLVRTIAPDRGMLSTAGGRPTMTIALLHNASLPYREYFSDLEPLLRSFDGRPHWGKKHSATAPRLASLYPEWNEFGAVRRELDPEGVFLNDHLRELLIEPPDGRQPSPDEIWKER
ncbi:D-arabinono-1,4-lactone oxidase [Citricoccus sp. GCM10030269]|uniref:D-arabinono-1,4-lactone oxidase n=1 Tax=Citricoccus sp. GCM10030269 TaxID=3273388 RepID=UPI003617AE61